MVFSGNLSHEVASDYAVEVNWEFRNEINFISENMRS